jgi:hypothetical protein
VSLVAPLNNHLVLPDGQRDRIGVVLVSPRYSLNIRAAAQTVSILLAAR